jgi:heme/copper-type cytochrome/quinol oxidase subunit 2
VCTQTHTHPRAELDPLGLVVAGVVGEGELGAHDVHTRRGHRVVHLTMMMMMTMMMVMVVVVVVMN